MASCSPPHKGEIPSFLFFSFFLGSASFPSMVETLLFSFLREPNRPGFLPPFPSSDSNNDKIGTSFSLFPTFGGGAREKEIPLFFLLSSNSNSRGFFLLLPFWRMGCISECSALDFFFAQICPFLFLNFSREGNRELFFFSFFPGG